MLIYSTKENFSHSLSTHDILLFVICLIFFICFFYVLFLLDSWFLSVLNMITHSKIDNCYTGYIRMSITIIWKILTFQVNTMMIRNLKFLVLIQKFQAWVWKFKPSIFMFVYIFCFTLIYSFYDLISKNFLYCTEDALLF